jgi:seryl-tRNA synthetase
VLDLKLIREDPDAVRKGLARRGGSFPIDEVVELDAHRRGAQARLDSLRAEQKKGGQLVSKMKGNEKKELLDRLKSMSDEITELEQEQDSIASDLNRLLLEIPNIPHESVPEGASEEENVELYKVGEPRALDFEPKDHLEIGDALGIIDVERAARTSGSRFGYLKGAGALLWLAMSRFALEVLAEEGFSVVVPPVLVRREAMEGTGFLPTDEQQIYKTADDDLYLVGTSEVPLAALHMGEVLDPQSLPLRYVGISTCFRREAGAHGRDTRGIFRVHQFEKVEMFAFVRAGESWVEHDRLVAIEESILRSLELPYRAVNVCAGDLGAPAAKKIDLEAWFPGQQRYREVTSCSNTTDYQARRLNCRIKTDRGPEFVHTLNGTAVTSSRHLAAIIENGQQSDGSVIVPEVLRPFTGFDVIAPA